MKTHSQNLIEKLGKPEIDLGLAVLECFARPGVSMPTKIIAEACGCHHSRIQQIERQAMKNVRLRLVNMGIKNALYR